MYRKMKLLTTVDGNEMSRKKKDNDVNRDGKDKKKTATWKR